ncbi:MAG: nuclear transport factor 2 family protein [Myxococcales bacterium]|nr:nuclear transport factor 2 family protein [Myxococcales bacterium]
MTLNLADRLELHELVARLAHLSDLADWKTYLSHFIEDATMDPGFAPPTRGVTEIEAFLRQTEGGTKGKRHVATNVLVEGAGDEATVISYLVVLEREEIPKVVATAVIRDRVVRRDGVWKVARHEVAVDPGMFVAMNGA